MNIINRIRESSKSKKKAEIHPLRYEGAEKLPMGLVNRERYFKACKRCDTFERQNQIRCGPNCKGELIFDPGFLAWKSKTRTDDDEQD